MPGEGQFVRPVQVEVTSDNGADVGLDATAPPGTQLRGLAIMGYYPAGNQLFVPRTDATGALITSGGGGGGVGITDTDDNSIASGQTTLLAIDENYVFNGTIWIRLQGGTHGVAGPASPQGGFVAGIARSTLSVLVDGQVAVPTFDLSGRLASATVGSPGTTLTDPADTAVGVGVTVALPVPPAGTRRQTVQVTAGNGATRIRVRAAGGGAGTGRLLSLLGSTFYGGSDGSIAALEVQHVAGAAAAVHIDFES